MQRFKMQIDKKTLVKERIIRDIKTLIKRYPFIPFRDELCERLWLIIDMIPDTFNEWEFNALYGELEPILYRYSCLKKHKVK